MNKPKGLFVLEPQWFEIIYHPSDLELLQSQIEFPNRAWAPAEVYSHPGLLDDVEVLFSGWYGPIFEKKFLDLAPRLKAVFFGGGSIRHFVRDEFWQRGIILSTSAAANAVPVAEFTFAQIILSLKKVWRHTRDMHRTRKYPGTEFYQEERAPGAYHATVGIVSLGMVGRRLREMLRQLEVHVVVYDPFVSREQAAELDVELVSLPELFLRSDVVTLHAPHLPETEGMITGELIASMKAETTLINTARGAIINEPEMIEVLRRRPDLFAVLDVFSKEPLPPESPLFTLPNVVLTPHIAGSIGNECRRMGRWMIEEAGRYVAGKPLQLEVTREKAAILA